MHMPAETTADLLLTQQQEEAIDYVVRNLHLGLVAIFGPAGSGKSTVLLELTRRLAKNKQVCVTAMTNKAVLVVRSKGVPDATTFHQTCMRPIFRAPLDKLGTFLEQSELTDTSKADYPKTLITEFGRQALERSLQMRKTTGIYAAFRLLGITDVFKYIESWEPSSQKSGVLIVDEASMLGDKELEMAKSVFSQIVLVGDPYQLPPVKSEPVFWKCENKYELTEIHRQAEGSQPLIIATAIRNGTHFDVSPIENVKAEFCSSGVPVIVWRNSARIEMTLAIREKLGYKGFPPQAGEPLICRNVQDRDAKEIGLLNNTTWTVLDAEGYSCTIVNELGDVLSGISVHMEETEKGHGLPFRFGYVISGHSSQGSQWPEVMVCHPEAKRYFAMNREDAKKWLYTAVTRAAQRVHWVTSKVV
jgi:exodeoxyribonuclease-5